MARASFRHALLQEAVYDGLLPGERRRYHLGFARALEAGGGPEVVHHALAANDLELALRASIAAGAAASAAVASADASRLLNVPSSCTTRCPLRRHSSKVADAESWSRRTRRRACRVIPNGDCVCGARH